MENGCEAVLSPSLILLVLWSPSLILLVRASAISCVNTAEAVRSVSLALLPESTGIRHFNGNTFNLFDADGNEEVLLLATSAKAPRAPGALLLLLLLPALAHLFGADDGTGAGGGNSISINDAVVFSERREL